MKKFYTFLLLMTVCLVSNAQFKLDAPAVNLLNQYKTIVSGGEVLNPDLRLVGDLHVPSDGIVTMNTKGANDIGDNEIGATITLEKGYTFEDIELCDGMNIVNTIGTRFVLVSFKIKDMEWLANQKAVRFLSIGQEQTPTMINARPSGCVDAVQTGNGLEQSYNGTGVIVGMFDTGMDPNHINFTEMGDPSVSRVTRVWSYTSSSGAPTTVCETPASISSFTTDVPSETHGTHVMGIAAGAYNGKGSWSNKGKMTETNEFPLYGVATNSEIVMAGGRLYDNNIFDGLKRQIDYAHEVGKPIVVNLSLGSLLGAHNGESTFSQTLADLGEDAIICVAAGNDADTNCSFNMQGGGLNAVTLRNTVAFSRYATGSAHHLQVWNDRQDPFSKLEFVIFDKLNNEVLYSKEIPQDQYGSKRIMIGGSSLGSSYEKPGDVFDQAFTANGYITFLTLTDGASMCYVADIEHKLYNGSNTNLIPCIRVTRVRGQWVYGLNNGGVFESNGVPTSTYTDNGVTYAAFTVGTNNGSVSSSATGDNIICVGAYTSAVYFGLMSGNGMYSYNGHTEIDQPCSFSSYGRNTTTNQGLPDVSAPGSVILSSYNSYWNISGGVYAQASGAATRNNNTYYWGSMQGTSMACPFVTGVVGLWLQADPSLKVGDVKEILAKTSVKNSDYNSGNSDKKLQWGAGQIDALAGMKEVLSRKASIGGVWEDAEKRMVVTQDGGQLNVYVAGETALDARLFAVTGAQVASVKASGSEAVLSTDGLSKGVYVLSVQGAEGRYTRKIVIR